MSDNIKLIMGDDGRFHFYNGKYDMTIHCETQEKLDEVCTMLKRMVWHECVKDDQSSFPDDDRLVLISVENYSDPAIGWYQHDNDGGGYWTFGSEMPLTEFGLFVEGWWELPKKPTLEK